MAYSPRNNIVHAYPVIAFALTGRHVEALTFPGCHHAAAVEFSDGTVVHVLGGTFASRDAWLEDERQGQLAEFHGLIEPLPATVTATTEG